jgi:putative transposase
MQRSRTEYPCDLSEHQWESIKHLIPYARSGGRRRTTDVRQVINAIFYLVRTGIPWRYLPKNYFPPWRTVYGYFNQWSRKGVWQKINEVLILWIRTKVFERSELPHLGIVDSQSVRSQYGENRGYDAVKKVMGRKRQILVDTLGLMWSVHVHAGNINDPKGGVEVLRKLPQPVINHMEKILADSVYTWPFNWYAEDLNIQVELMKGRKKKPFISNLKPKRWVVERTFAWLVRFRRLSRDFEKLTRHSEAVILVAMIAIMLNKLR